MPASSTTTSSLVTATCTGLLFFVSRRDGTGKLCASSGEILSGCVDRLLLLVELGLELLPPRIVVPDRRMRALMVRFRDYRGMSSRLLFRGGSLLLRLRFA